MSRLRIFDEGQPDQPILNTADAASIAAELDRIGVRFEQWQPHADVQPGASQEDIFAAFREDIDRVVAEHGFTTVDVASIAPDNPNREAARAKFLDEHFHIEDEVRLFVAGAGQFTLHVEGRVYEVLCTKGDYIAVPDRTLHWFDMGPEPAFVAIRFFKDPEGWVGHFTGTDWAARFPRYEPESAA